MRLLLRRLLLPAAAAAAKKIDDDAASARKIADTAADDAAAFKKIAAFSAATAAKKIDDNAGRRHLNQSGDFRGKASMTIILSQPLFCLLDGLYISLGTIKMLVLSLYFISHNMLDPSTWELVATAESLLSSSRYRSLKEMHLYSSSHWRM